MKDEQTVTSNTVLSKRTLGWASLAAVLACVGCCTLPMLAVAVLGGGAAASATALLMGAEPYAAGAAALLTVSVIAWRARARKGGCTTSCRTDGACCDTGQAARAS